MTTAVKENIFVPPSPCPPEEFSGRHKEREIILGALSRVKDCGQVVMISGARGAGKSSLLDWVEHEIQRTDGELESPAVKKKFFETPGMIFVSYQELLKDLQGHTGFRWFKYIVNSDPVQKGFTVFFNTLKECTTPIDPAGILARAGGEFLKAFPSAPVEHHQLLRTFLDVLKRLSEELSQEDGCVALLLDEAQWSSDIDYLLLKDLIRSIPPNIALIFTYRLEEATRSNYEELQMELKRYNHQEVFLGGMQSRCIRDLLVNRYHQEPDEAALEFLKDNIGDPSSLIACLNLLQMKNLALNIDNIQENMREAIANPVEVVYRCLDEKQAEWTTRLCVLNPPMPLTIMACMLQYPPGQVCRLQDELKRSYAFIETERGLYEFAHPSLREYRKDRLPEEDLVVFHENAAKCFKDRIGILPDKLYVNLSLAEHAFYGRDYQTAFALNFELGDMLSDRYNYTDALKLMTRAKMSAETLNNWEGMAAAYHHIGMIYQALYEGSKALDYYEQCLAISREFNIRDGEAATLHQIGIVHAEERQYKIALEYYNQSQEVSRAIGFRFCEAGTLHQIGMVHEIIRQYDKALEYYRQSLTISQDIKERAGEARTLHQMGSVYVRMQQYDNALNYYNQCLAISQETGNRAARSAALNQMGMVYRKIEKFDEALDCYNQSLAISRETGNRVNEANALHQMGMVYELIQTDKALDYYNQSLAISREIGNREGEVLTLAQTGHHFMTTSRFNESIRSFGKALPIALQDQMRESSFWILLDLALILDQMGEEEFTVAWGEAFDGDAPPLETIRETEKVFKEAMGID